MQRPANGSHRLRLMDIDQLSHPGAHKLNYARAFIIAGRYPVFFLQFLVHQLHEY